MKRRLPARFMDNASNLLDEYSMFGVKIRDIHEDDLRPALALAIKNDIDARKLHAHTISSLHDIYTAGRR